MKSLSKSKCQSILLVLIIVIFSAGSAFGQDAAKVDSNHYKVVFENNEMRVLHISYGPGEKSVMHSHPEGLAIFITDGVGKFTFPDGKTQTTTFKAGQVVWLPPQTHLPQNTGTKRFELYQVEMKPQTKKMEMKPKPEGK
ncbi:cupin domain protein [bacterium BMS3Abin04]|nr:cupin domain protein [bacterium BMS3Abin04]